MYSLMFASWLSASAAPLAPSSRRTSSCARRERTSAYSAITKNALIATRSAAMMSLSPFTRDRRFPAPLGRPPRGCGRDKLVGGRSGPCYFGEDLRRRSSLADRSTVARARVGRTACAPGSGRPVDLAGQAKVGVREAPFGVGRERQADLVPAVEQDVGVVVRRLGDLGHAVDEGDRRGEVLEPPLALD